MTKDELASMSFLDVLRHAYKLAGMERAEVFEAMGWSPSQGNRILSTDNYWLSSLSIPEYCRVVGNRVVLDWYEVQVERILGPAKFDPVSCQEFVFGMGRLFRRLGDLAKHGERAAADQEISTREAMTLIEGLHRLMAESATMMNGLRAIAGRPEDKERNQ